MRTQNAIYLILTFIVFSLILYYLVLIIFRIAAGRSSSRPIFTASIISFRRLRCVSNRNDFLNEMGDENYSRKMWYPFKKQIALLFFCIHKYVDKYKIIYRALIRKERIRQTLARIKWEKKKAKIKRVTMESLFLISLLLFIYFLYMKIDDIKMWIAINYSEYVINKKIDSMKNP